MKKILIIIVLVIALYMYRYVYFEHSFMINRFHFYSLNKAKVTLTEGENFRIKVRGINIRCSYKSSNMRVATVDFCGNIHAVSAGRAIIYVRVKGHKNLKCYIKVKKRTT